MKKETSWNKMFFHAKKPVFMFPRALSCLERSLVFLLGWYDLKRKSLCESVLFMMVEWQSIPKVSGLKLWHMFSWQIYSRTGLSENPKETHGPASTRVGSGPAAGAEVAGAPPTSLSPSPSAWSPCGLSCWWPQGDWDSFIGVSSSKVRVLGERWQEPCC